MSAISNVKGSLYSIIRSKDKQSNTYTNVNKVSNVFPCISGTSLLWTPLGQVNVP